jgi:mannose-6-phosphate isomerase-like protein (cupin superfamily)
MVKPIRRVVAGNDDRGVAVALSDGPSPDVRLDPARPGFASTRLWVTEATPARVKGIRETLHLPHTIEPPPNGSVCRVVEFPPEASYISKVSAADVAAYFAAMGSPGASTAKAGAPHPYMQRTRSFDFCYVLEGEITLVLDTEEVHLKEGDTVIQRGTSHAWSNRSDKPCIVVFSQHDGVM